MQIAHPHLNEGDMPKVSHALSQHPVRTVSLGQERSMVRIVAQQKVSVLLSVEVMQQGTYYNMARYWLDPPEGHRFGFPKDFEGDPDLLDINQWLLNNGYPQEEIDR